MCLAGRADAAEEGGGYVSLVAPHRCERHLFLLLMAHRREWRYCFDLFIEIELRMRKSALLLSLLPSMKKYRVSQFIDSI